MSQQQATMRLPMPWEDGEPRRDKDGRVFRFDTNCKPYLGVFYCLDGNAENAENGEYDTSNTAVSYSYLEASTPLTASAKGETKREMIFDLDGI